MPISYILLPWPPGHMCAWLAPLWVEAARLSACTWQRIHFSLEIRNLLLKRARCRGGRSAHTHATHHTNTISDEYRWKGVVQMLGRCHIHIGHLNLRKRSLAMIGGEQVVVGIKLNVITCYPVSSKPSCFWYNAALEHEMRTKDEGQKDNTVGVLLLRVFLCVCLIYLLR